jgi:hypothetical protein
VSERAVEDLPRNPAAHEALDGRPDPSAASRGTRAWSRRTGRACIAPRSTPRARSITRRVSETGPGGSPFSW